MNLAYLSRALTALAGLGATVGGLLAAGQVPASLRPWAALLASLGTVAALFAKTPSAAIAAAVPPAKDAPSP